MLTTKVFNNGRSQAIRLPKEARFNEDEELIIKKIGDTLLVYPKTKAFDIFLKGVNGFSDDFMKDGRNDLIPDKRDSL